MSLSRSHMVTFCLGAMLAFYASMVVVLLVLDQLDAVILIASCVLAMVALVIAVAAAQHERRRASGVCAQTPDAAESLPYLFDDDDQAFEGDIPVAFSRTYSYREDDDLFAPPPAQPPQSPVPAPASPPPPAQPPAMIFAPYVPTPAQPARTPSYSDDRSAPWDDIEMETPPAPSAGALAGSPLLPRRPARLAEYQQIRDIYAQTGSLNATIRAVYGTKDAKTHSWIKTALEATL